MEPTEEGVQERLLAEAAIGDGCYVATRQDHGNPSARPTSIAASDSTKAAPLLTAGTDWCGPRGRPHSARPPSG